MITEIRNTQNKMEPKKSNGNKTKIEEETKMRNCFRVKCVEPVVV